MASSRRRSSSRLSKETPEETNSPLQEDVELQEFLDKAAEDLFLRIDELEQKESFVAPEIIPTDFVEVAIKVTPEPVLNSTPAKKLNNKGQKRKPRNIPRFSQIVS